MKSIHFLFLGLIVLTLVNCGVNSDPVQCPPRFTGELEVDETKLVGQWIASGVISDVEVDLTNDNMDNPNFNMFTQYSDCAKDAIFIFDENRIYSYDVGSTISACLKNSTIGSWKLSSGELFLLIDCSNISYTISFNEDNTQFEYTNNIDVQEVNGLVTPAKVTFTFSKVPPQ